MTTVVSLVLNVLELVDVLAALSSPPPLAYSPESWCLLSELCLATLSSSLCSMARLVSGTVLLPSSRSRSRRCRHPITIGPPSFRSLSGHLSAHTLSLTSTSISVLLLRCISSSLACAALVLLSFCNHSSSCAPPATLSLSAIPRSCACVSGLSLPCQYLARVFFVSHLCSSLHRVPRAPCHAALLSLGPTHVSRASLRPSRLALVSAVPAPLHACPLPMSCLRPGYAHARRLLFIRSAYI